MANPLLSGIRILDLSRLLPGPFCTLYLAQLGAEVIKIEEPGGEYGRTLGEVFPLVNRGKKSVALDLRRPGDVELFHRMVEKADAVVETFRPGVMDRLGCGYQVLAKLNPRLVYAALTGYGQSGPYRDRPGHDINYCGYAGVLDQVGAAGAPPSPLNVQIADLAGGALTCAVGMLAALIGARASGCGSFVDVAMLDGTLALQVAALATLRSTGKSAPRGQDMLSGGLPNYSLYETADGRYLAVGTLEYKFFARACALAGRPDLLQMPLAPGEAGQPLREALTALFKGRTRDEWEQLLAHEDTCVSPVLTLEEALQNEQVRARGLVQTADGKPAFGLPIRFSQPLPAVADSPGPGEHTEQVLQELGLRPRG